MIRATGSSSLSCSLLLLFVWPRSYTQISASSDMILNPYLGKYRTISFPVYYGPSYPSADIGWCSIGDFWNDDEEKYTGPPSPSFVRGGGGYIFARKLISSFRDETTHDWRGWIIISQRLSPNDMATDLQRLPMCVRGDDDGYIKTFSYWGCWGLARSTTTISIRFINLFASQATTTTQVKSTATPTR